MTSEDVRPKWSQRADGPTCSATEVVNAITSCWVVFSISSMRAMSNPPRSRMSLAASAGTIPARAIASAAAISTCSQVSYRRDSLQMRPISGFVYRGIIGGASTRRPSSEQKPFPGNLEAVDRAEHGGRQGLVGKQVACHAQDVVLSHALHALERFVQAEVPVEVDLLPRQVRHPARRALEVQHQAALEMILRALQLGVRQRLVLHPPQLDDHDVDQLA